MSDATNHGTGDAADQALLGCPLANYHLPHPSCEFVMGFGKQAQLAGPASNTRFSGQIPWVMNGWYGSLSAKRKRSIGCHLTSLRISFLLITDDGVRSPK